jgi:tripartite-type tricarboxylate transporter receptor subunit TctC
MISRRSALGLLALAAAVAAPIGSAMALDYPTRPVRWVVGYPPGGATDIIARLIGQRLQEKLGQPFVIENKPGAGNNIATESVVNAAPDGYTLLLVNPANYINTSLYANLKFNVPSDIAPVASFNRVPNVMTVNKDVPAKTVAEFIAYVKANPGKVNFASQGNGTTSHLTAELYNTLTGARMVHVPYRGTGPALNDIVAGHVDLIFMQLSAAMRLHEGNKARILAVTTEKRLDILKDMPTMIEAGIPNFVSDTWNAMVAPPGTPAAIVAKLNKAINEIAHDPDTQKRFASLNVEPLGGSPAELRKLIQDETRRWGEVIKKAGIQPE